MYKPHARPHTMKKMHTKFHNDQYKTVRGVELTRGTRCLYIEGEKCLSSQCGKCDKNNLTIISKPHTHPQTMKKKKTNAKFQDDQYKSVLKELRPQEAPTVFIIIEDENHTHILIQ